MKQRKKRGDRILKAKSSGYEEREIRRLGRARLLVGILLIGVAAAAAWFVWKQISVFDGGEETESSQAASASSAPSSQEEILPVYGNDFNLKLASAEHPLAQEEKPQLEKYEDVQMDARIIPALEAMLEAAKKQGVPMKVVQGYISPEEQNLLFEKEVKRLKKKKGYSQVMAEQTAEQSVSRGGQDEMQTGMTVKIESENEEESFQNTAQYRWLSRHSIEYGFVFRYPQGKKPYTGKEFQPACIRYVGNRAAGRMRQLQMCLEEYVNYLNC